MNKLSKCDANKMPVTPITFLKRASMFYGCRNSIIYGSLRFTWEETYNRCRRLASVLQLLGIAKNDVVSVLAPNIPALYEMHFGVPMAGAILNAINTRLDANTIKTILEHSEAKLIFVDYEYMPLVDEAINLVEVANKSPSPTNTRIIPRVIIIKEMEESINNSTDMEVSLSHEHDDHQLLEYEQLINMGNKDYEIVMLEDEWDPITLNYTSGTTSSPKGVVYTHRGAYLTTLSVLLAWEMGVEPVYLWSLPMFHGNGWTFPWGIAARGGTNICMRNITASEMYKHFAMHGVTHMCCAPVVLKMLLEDKPVMIKQRSSQVKILTGGAPPPRALLKEMANMGFHVMQTYGLTDASGSVLFCEWSKEWDSLSLDEKAQLKARQGVTALHIADLDVIDVITMQRVPQDGKTTGEIVIRGSGIMKEYFKDNDSTSTAFANKWLHTGDMGVIHPDGYIEIKDRLKDIIISGGENISSVAVEVIRRNTKVSEVAVVAMPHPHWGESPCAFVVKNTGGEDVTEHHILRYCRNNLPHYMVPKKIAFVKELPMTSTGKVQKSALRAIAKTFQVPTTVKDELGISEKAATSRL